ncbi:Ste:CG33243 [Drosophila busckii]|uniref:Casein kinase II subunit beta n=1 Tax=Drosophila busckii TaxID=30019 RepID=A0A0M4EUC1_DROBS|nr:suppressor-of-stellate-like protein [Drosophila busckii]ALC40995.1 Ste:CG33243 [Drosophila busckii]
MDIGDGSWISWYVGQPTHEFLCRVPHDYVRDRFNLTGLDDLVQNFDDTLEALLEPEFDAAFVPEAVEQLYGLIHARYIITYHGVLNMSVKYQRGDFGMCPRIHCNGQFVLPVGLTDHMGESHVKIYCARCRDIYQPHTRCALLDGAMFGCSFPHMFFMQLPQLLPQPPVESYIPRLYGFKLHSKALMPKQEEKSTPEAAAAAAAAAAASKEHKENIPHNY